MYLHLSGESCEFRSEISVLRGVPSVFLRCDVCVICPATEEGWVSMALELISQNLLPFLIFLNISLQTHMTEFILNLSVSSKEDFLPVMVS